MNNDGKTKQVILVRKDLNMSKGKIAAQVAHASLFAFLNREQNKEKEVSIKIDLENPVNAEWLFHRSTKVCLSVNSEKELLAYFKEAKEKGLKCSLIKDAGFTELDGSNYTAVGIGPDYIEKIDEITKDLKLLY